ncbi:MAG: HupE/UreJ family protein [Desulfobulbaceae bacterium]|nr:HupE/UreJ family protein [Desulfobulbaceae bacterium]
MHRRIILTLMILFATGWGSLPNVQAHESRPAVLNIIEQKPGWFEVTWKVPLLAEDQVDIRPVFPESMAAYGPPANHNVPGAMVEYSTYQAEGDALSGKTITIDGLSTTQIDVMVRINLADGTSYSTILRPASPSYVIPSPGTRAEIAWVYLRLGIEHILQGVDHLLFVLGLLLIVGSRKGMLFKTITAFTIAHSITLGIATLGYASAPGPPLNAAIALSILFLGPEIVRVWRGRTSFTIRHPWVVAFAFGLLHGFGFASGLSTAGLPSAEIPVALLLFNVGVEIGQLFFVAIMLLLERSFRILEIRWPRWAEAMPAYTVGGLGAFWTIQRVAIMVGGLVR